MLFYLNLIKNINVLVFGMVVQIVNKNGSIEYSKLLYIVFYDGYVILDFNLKVVIGNYDGLVSIIVKVFFNFVND